MGRDSGRLDWLVELGGAAAPAAAAGYAAFKLAPSFAVPTGFAASLSSLSGFALAFLAMRLVRPEPRFHALPKFIIEPIAEVDELLLDEVYEELGEVLLLEDMLNPPEPGSRVVRLLTPEAMPTAGQLKDRIDRHLANAPRPAEERPIPDASDALYQALAELRRSLR